MPRGDADPTTNIPQPVAAPMPPPMPAPVSARKVTITKFEAKSARDGALYDIAKFLAQRNLEIGDMEVQVRFDGFGPEEDEWVNVVSHVRHRSLPCEASEYIVVVPGDLILCFQGMNDLVSMDQHKTSLDFPTADVPRVIPAASISQAHVPVRSLLRNTNC